MERARHREREREVRERNLLSLPFHPYGVFIITSPVITMRCEEGHTLQSFHTQTHTLSKALDINTYTYK
jgi:hypothetical protein